MRICLLLLLVGTLQTFAVVSYSQSMKLTLNFNNATIEEILNHIEKESEFYFTYSHTQVNTAKRVSLKATEEEVTEILGKLFVDQNVKYQVNDRHVVLYREREKNTSSSISAANQQGNKITGVVVDAMREPVIGANVVQKGTTNGTITDFDGNFELTVPVGAEIEVTYIGFVTQHMAVVEGKDRYLINLVEDSQSLDEVVVVGYGVQKKKLVTGATVQVKGDDIQKLSTTSPLSALQSQTPGVNITQGSGQPGEDFKVTVRGLGTIGDSAPLYVIDGIAGGDINVLNPSDIESIDVLKDAASAAIYGARAANGVILVTTRQGKSGKPQLSYDGYVGWQNVYRMPSTLNAQEYIAVMDEIAFNMGYDDIDWASQLPGYLYQSILDGSWNGTNWMEEIRNKNALTQNHSINLIGGQEYSKYSVGFSYTSQDGILGKPVEPNYERYTGRVNTEYNVIKVKDRDLLKIGQNLTYSYTEKTGIGVGNIYSNDIRSMISGLPLLPVYNSEGNYYDQDDKYAEGWLLDGTASNPIASMVYNRGQNISKRHTLQANAYVEIQPVTDLKFRSVFGYKMSSSAYRSYNAAYNLSSTNTNAYDKVNQNAKVGYNVTWENTLAYNFKVNNQHSIDALIGQSIEKWGMGDNINASGARSIFPDMFDYAWLNNTNPNELSEVTIGGSPWESGALASFFGRVNYNYKETYMASVILRADGSANFARGHRWGYFPSVSAGWVMTNEPFMESMSGWMDFLKLRASWGQNGNASIANFQYIGTVAFDDSNRYYFGDSNSASVGAYRDILPNKELTWETSEQIDLGVDARFLASRLGVVFDWYRKTTKDWLVVAPQLASYGTGAPYINGGDVRNKGFEFAVNWNDRIGKDFSYGVNVNLTYNTNKVTRIANEEGVIHGVPHVLSQNTQEMYRAEVGYPIGYFYGYKTEGIFQNQAQIDQYIADGKGVFEGTKPGDVIFADLNQDGVIDENDKTMIGNPHPDFALGLGMNFGYKGFDLSLTATGSFGHQIAKAYYNFADTRYENYTRDVFNRWTGEGTSNKWPRLTYGTNINYQYISDIWIENADYVKLQNITLGYDFKKLFPNMPLGQARLYVTAQNLFTITGYSGLDPEVGYGGDTTSGDGNWASGIDLGFYPSPRTYLIGVNLKF